MWTPRERPPPRAPREPREPRAPRPPRPPRGTNDGAKDGPRRGQLNKGVAPPAPLESLPSLSRRLAASTAATGALQRANEAGAAHKEQCAGKRLRARLHMAMQASLAAADSHARLTMGDDDEQAGNMTAALSMVPEVTATLDRLAVTGPNGPHAQEGPDEVLEVLARHAQSGPGRHLLQSTGQEEPLVREA